MTALEVVTVPSDPDSPDAAEISKPTLRVSRVPLELWCEITQYVDTRSLLRLGTTSKSFNHLINSTRSIWSVKVVTMIRQACLPPYSLVLADADTSSLKALATRTARFLFALRKRRVRGATEKLYSLSSKSLRYVHDDGSKQTPPFHQALPGGRWALTANNVGKASHICCWDLHQLSRDPVLHRFNKPLAIFDVDGDESAVICQASPQDHSVIVMVRTCSAEGEYDVEIVRLYWTSSGGHEEAEPKFEHVNRLNPGAIFIEAAYLEGSLACMGSGPDWILWDWKENTAVKVDLESSSGENTMHMMLRHDAFFTISRGGRISMFIMPIMKEIEAGQISSLVISPIVTSEPYGTLRKSTTLDAWIPICARSRSLVCLKTTVIPATTLEAVEARAFACPAILLDYSLRPSTSLPTVDQPLPIEQLNELLPQAVYYGRGNLDWRGVFSMAEGMLLEQSIQVKARPEAPSRPLPQLFFDFHHKVSSPRERRPTFPGALVLDTAQFVDPVNEDEFRQGLSICYTTGRVLLTRPRLGCIESFEFV